MLSHGWWKHWGTRIRIASFGGDLQSRRLISGSHSRGTVSLAILLEEGGRSRWMESQISTPRDFKWSCDGPGSLCLISHRQLSYLPWYSILRLSSAADGCRGCVEEQREALHPHNSCWGRWGTSRAETGNLMIDAVSESSGRLRHFPRASPGSLSVMMQRGRA